MYKLNISKELLNAVKEVFEETNILDEKKKEILSDFGTTSEKGLTIEQQKEFNKKLNKENLQELSKKTLSSYKSKAGMDAVNKGNDADRATIRANASYEAASNKKLTPADRGNHAAKADADVARAKIAYRKHKNRIAGLKLADKKRWGVGVKVKATNEETLRESVGHNEDHVRELVLHADNDSHLHRSSHVPIMKNLAKKHAKGMYDSEKAKKLWKYHADRATSKLTNEENIQEISQSLIKSYQTKAGMDAINHGNDTFRAQNLVKKANAAAKNIKLKAVTRDKHIQTGQEAEKRANNSLRKYKNRKKGLALASGKSLGLAKVPAK